MSVKNSTYNITPVAAMIEECANNLGFGGRKLLKIRQAVEEMLIASVNETAEDIGDIEITMQYLQTKLRVTFVVAEVEDTAERKKSYKIASAIVLRLVDDSDYRQLDSIKHFFALDFAYDEDFDIKDFLMKHEPIG
jgi:fatty-acyl-CoA synthase